MKEGELKDRLAPIARLLGAQDAVRVYVNGPEQVYVEKKESFERAGWGFAGAEELESLVRTCATSVGRKLTGKEPAFHIRLESGTTVAAFRLPGAESPLLCFTKYQP
ncbi:MAG: hypothetical protein ABII00_05280 [Elusimicrobiota bacterium]